MKQHWSDELVAMGACADAVTWAKKQPSATKAWKSCKRGDWMAWLLARYAGWTPPYFAVLALVAVGPAIWSAASAAKRRQGSG